MSATSVTVTIAGAPRTGEILQGSITIRDVLDEAPNTCSFTVIGTTQEGAFDVSAFEESAFNCDVAVTSDSGAFEPAAFEDSAFDTTQGAFVAIAPVIDAEVRITLGDGTVLFGGQIDTVEEFYEGGRRTNRAWHVGCTDYSRLANRRKVRIRYLTQSASTIATDVVTRFTSGFTTNAIQPGLPAIAIEFTDETVVGALTRIADRIGGYCYIDYNKDVHLFITESTATPDPITEASAGTSWARALRATLDARQRRTRVYVEGGGSTAQNAVRAGSTSIPVLDATWYSGSGGVVVSGPQRIPYAGKGIAGGPTALLATAVTTPGNLGRGPYTYKYAFVTSGTEGPLSAVSNTPSPESMSVAAPSTAVTLAATGQSVSAPTNTLTLALTGYVAPPSAPTTSNAPLPNDSSLWDIGDQLAVQMTYVTASAETQAGPLSNTTTMLAGNNPTYPDFARALMITNLSVSPDGTVTGRRVYIRVNGSWLWWQLLDANSPTATIAFPDSHTSPPPTTNGTATGSMTPGALYRYRLTYVTATGETTGSQEQTIDLTGGARSVAVSTIPTSGDGRVTARRLYRTKANQSTCFLVTTLADNTTTVYTDTKADSALGAELPTTNTTGSGNLTTGALYRYRVTYITAQGETSGGPEASITLTGGASTAALTNVSVSADARVTARKIYRTQANGSEFLFEQTIANNTGSTATSSSADTALGAPLPTTNTAIGGCQMALTNIAKGGGSVTARNIYRTTAGGNAYKLLITLADNTTTTYTDNKADSSLGTTSPDEAISELTGIPANAILYDIKKGDPVNIEVQVDDLTAQAEVGIIEHKIVDGRLSINEAQARGQADLLLHAPTLEDFSYQTRDTKTRSGKTIQVSLAIPAVTAALKIQDVTITEIDIAKNLPPLYTVQSSSVLFSYEDMLRRTRLFPT